MYIQVNAESVLKIKLIGDKHKHLKKKSKKYFDKGLVHFIASDMHNMETRKTHMKEAFEIIKNKYGLSKVLEVSEENQEKLLMNKVI